jgi:uncharacterized membrane protein
MAVIQEQGSGGDRFIVRPNCALSWRTTKFLIWFFAACLAAVGAYFASLGAWLVFPFAGLELTVLVAGFYLSALAGHTREVIELDGPVLRVRRGRRRLDEVASFPANWTRIVLSRDPRGWYPSRLLLRCQDEGVEVGAELVEGEREELAASLRGLLDFRLAPSDESDPVAISDRSGLQAQTGHGDRAAIDADANAVTSTSLGSNGARVAGCARGAFTEKREDLWQ